MNKGKDFSLLIITAMFFAGILIAQIAGVPVKRIMQNYSYDVLVILIIMELFTGLVAQTGIMQKIAVFIVSRSEGMRRPCLIMFGAAMFAISACLNNITAVMMILPVIFVFMKAVDVDENFVCTFFAAILALSNTGGAASPIGDFPAIVIMTSGITDFTSYLWRALFLFGITSAVLIAVYSRSISGNESGESMRRLAVLNLQSQYRNCEMRKDVLSGLMINFALMFIAWSVNIFPPEIVAVLGYVLALLFCVIKGVRISMSMDMKSLLTIASFLFFAETVSQTGILHVMAGFLQTHITNPKLLVSVIMIITSLAAGVFSAGPAAAAMMPVVIELCGGSLASHSHWIAVSYAAAICAGSSLFMWSATAGFILSEKVSEAHIGDNLRWGVKQYFKYGIINYLVQMSIALIVANIVI